MANGVSAAPTVGLPEKESSLAWIGSSHNLLDFVGRLINVKEHQRAQAMQQLQGLYQMSSQGFPIKGDAFSKLVKKAGLPLETDPEKLKAYFANMAGELNAGVTPSGQPTPQATGGGGGGPAGLAAMAGSMAKQMQAPDGADGATRAAVDMRNRITSSGKPIDAGEMMGMYVQALGARARRILGMQAASQEQAAENELMVKHLEARSLRGDAEATGTLMRHGLISVPISTVEYMDKTPKQREAMFNIQAGQEPESSKIDAGRRIGEALFASGKVSNIGAAYKLGDTLSHGGTIPPELQSQMKPYTFTEQTQQAHLMGLYTELGVPPDKLASTMQRAEIMGLPDAVPPGLKPLAAERMQLQMEKLAAQSEVQEARYMAIAAKMDAAVANASTNEQKIAGENLERLAMAKKYNPSMVTDEMVNAAQRRFAKAYNMDISETQSWWQRHVSGSSTTTFTPRADQSTVDKLLGQQQQQAQPQKEPGFADYFKIGVGAIGSAARKARQALKEPI